MLFEENYYGFMSGHMEADETITNSLIQLSFSLPFDGDKHCFNQIVNVFLHCGKCGMKVKQYSEVIVVWSVIAEIKILVKLKNL